jgi:hypothetical protein
MLLAAATMLVASPCCAACYGAVAASVSDHKSGMSWGSAIRADAERSAIYDCQRRGGRDCQVISWERKEHCAGSQADGQPRDRQREARRSHQVAALTRIEARPRAHHPNPPTAWRPRHWHHQWHTIESRCF